MKSKRFWFILLTVLLITAVLTACGGSEPAEEDQPATTAEETEQEAAPDQNIFVYASTTSYPDINPATSFSNDSLITSNCYETLTFYNAPGSTEVISPKLAESWEVNEDNTVWTFKIREGVTFHDGEPLNAEAVKSAIENTIEIGASASYIWAPVESIEVVDEYNVQFNLIYSAPMDLIASSGYAAWIYSMKAYNENGADWFNEGNCAGTGPYIIDSYERGSRLIMTRNEDYWGGWSDGQFDTAVFEIVEDPVVRQQKIEAGTADFTYEVPSDNLATLDSRDDITVFTNPSFQNLVGLFNTQKPPLDDALVRQALSYTFPYEQFITAIMGNRAVQARGPVPGGIWGHNADMLQYNHDMDKARELLAEAGYADGGFDLLFTYATGDLEEQQIGELWKAELATLGINLELQAMTWEAQWELGQSDPQNAQDVFVMYWWPDYVTPTTFLFNMFLTEEETLFNLGYYSNPEFDDLVLEADAISGSDQEEAANLFGHAQEILVNDAAAMFFYDLANTHLARSDINGYVDNPAYPHVVFVYDLSR
ncbi:ABC transporter substrate-binding protein [Candidatus Leptofilum sp.]|uniref:ABC transporter substrate-binding protein n=1 Tax=Candidatus Leptofilum sp. TaxID=3241576 RepID=UPI003B5AD501